MSTMAQVRNTLTSTLKPALGKRFVIFPQGNGVDEVTKPTLLLERTRVEKLPQAPRSAHQNFFDVILLVPSNSSEDYLDDVLEDVLEAFDDLPDALWSSAERAVFEAVYPCYRISIQALSVRKDG